MSYLRCGGRGAAGWLALAVLTGAVGGAGGVLAASPALAGSLVTVTTTTAETTAGDGTCSLPEALAYAQRLNGSNTDCGTTATGTTVISLAEGTYAVPPANASRSHLEIGSGAPGPVVIEGPALGTIGTAIDGQGAHGRMLLIDPGATVILKNLTLRGGLEDLTGSGGGINNQGTLTLDHVTVTGNRTQAPSFLPPAIFVPFHGGGIYNTGTLNLVHSIIAGNSTDHGYTGLTIACFKVAAPGTDGGDGGGIYNQGGTVDAAYTAIADNSTGAGGDGATGQPGCESGGVGGLGGAGGGIYNNRGTVVLRQSAVYGNTTGAGGNGGASGPGGSGGMGGTGGAGAGLFSNGQLPVTDTTITDNVTGNGGTGGSGARPGGGGPGGGIFQAGGAATVQESTVAANTTGTGATAGRGGLVFGPGPGSGFYVDEGPLTEIDTIVSNDNCDTYLTFGQIRDGLAAGDGHLNLTYPATTTCPGIIADPHLGPLHDNGGPTSTMAITPPSPAIDRIPPLASAGCTPTDQRGIPRPQPAGGRCDIGAYEYQH